MNQPTAVVMEVTPRLAQEWLGVNTANRKLKSLSIASYARDMSQGRWLLNGEAIKLRGDISDPGKVQDGQNRLHACLKADKPFTTVVVFNVPDDAQATMDSGVKRTVADVLTISGHQHTHIAASAASLALRLDDGDASGKSGNISNARAVAFVEENPDIFRSAAVASQYAVHADAPKSVVAYTHWRFAKLDLDDATAFWRDCAEKIGLGADDPIIPFMSRLHSTRVNKERIAPGSVVAAAFRVWNLRREGAGRPRTIQFTVPDRMPRIK